MQKRIIIPCVILFFLCLSIAGVLWYFSNETEELQSQEQISQIVAEEYLIYVSQQAKIESTETSTEKEMSDLDYNDNEIYSYFTEDWAFGYVDCVIEIPAIDLRQSVYSGTSAQIEHDLSYWLPVTAREGYVLGETQYCIYVHNPRDKSIRISYAQENLHENDYIIVTQNSTVYLYKVTDVFPEWRDKCVDSYVDSKDVDSNKLYIFTCARDEWEGKNLVIEGTVYAIYHINDWNENKEEYIEQYKKNVGLLSKKQEEKEKKQLIMSVEAKDDKLIVSLENEEHTNIYECSIGVFDSDGYLVQDINNPIDYNGEEIAISTLPEGEYYIGVYENNTEYKSPPSYKIIINTNKLIQTIVQIDQEVEENNKTTSIMRIVAIVLLALSIICGAATIIKTIRKNRNKKEK